jgi:hypothetical protein
MQLNSLNIKSKKIENDFTKLTIFGIETVKFSNIINFFKKIILKI